MERGLAEHTLEAYRRDLERYAATLTAAGRTEIEDVSTQDVADFLAGLREGDDDTRRRSRRARRAGLSSPSADCTRSR